MSYSRWSFYPGNLRAPQWVMDLVSVTTSVQAEVSTVAARVADDPVDISSDGVLARLRPGLEALG